MIPLLFLWKWLYTNFIPDEEGGGILKEEIVRELLEHKEVDKPDNLQAAIFAKALVGRYLCLLYKASSQCKNRFTDSEQPQLFTLKRVTEEEREGRASAVPPFPHDLKAIILKELREERLGRSSARNLLQLMTTQPPKKKPRTLDSSAGPDSEATENSGEEQTSPPDSPTQRGLKRSSSSNELEPKRSRGDSSAGNASYRSLKKQVSSPVLSGQKGGQGQQPLFNQQEPWKREINDLWAKQLAMMREINTLKVELGRREAARQREILAMRQELDVMRAEIFRLRQIVGASPGKEGELVEGTEVTLTARTEPTDTETEESAETKVVTDSIVTEIENEK